MRITINVVDKKKGDSYIFTQLLSPAPQELEIEGVEIVRGSLEMRVVAVSETIQKQGQIGGSSHFAQAECFFRIEVGK
jgi:hypothetical protein